MYGVPWSSKKSCTVTMFGSFKEPASRDSRTKRRAAEGSAVPAWAYLGGVSGALTVMLSSLAANTVLALSGTLALGLVGQAAFGLAADRWGWLGMPRRPATPRALLSLLLILGGSAILIFGAPA